MKRKIISIIVVINIIFILAENFVVVSKAESVQQSISIDIQNIDESKYPGIKSKINELQKQYPKWNFKILYTGIKWEDAIKYEYTGHGSSPKNLVPISKNYSGNWVCSICKDETYDSGAWKCASEGALKYMMDPRNSINSSDVFQFLELSYNESKGYSKETVKTMLKGSFLKEEKYADAILNSCKKYNVNPYYIVARILQEQGKSGTTLTAGKGYNGQYIGYYNVFNIGACGSGKEKIILNGLAKAKSNDWTSLEKSIDGGIEIISKQYINRGQNTLYLQKFDVDNTDGNMYWHQYMQNILAAQTEGEILKKTFSEIDAVDNEYTFIIPVYENMPKEAELRPITTSNNNAITSDLVRINVTSSLKIRNEPAGNTTKGYLYAGEIATRIEKACQKVNGVYWDKILSSSGVEGYAARSTADSDDDYKLYLVPFEEYEEPIDTDMKVEVPIDTDMKVEENKQDKIIENDSQKRYKLGEITEDEIVDSADLLYLKKYLLGKIEFNETQKKSSDITKDGIIDSADLLYLKKYLLGKFQL